MKILLLIPILFLYSCSSTTIYKTITEQTIELGLYSYEDDHARCYIYRDDNGNSMFCLRKELK